MSITPPVERLLTERDYARLNQIDGGHLPPALEQALAMTNLVASRAVPDNVLTMYSQAVVEHLGTRRQQKFTLCFPQDAEPSSGFISVLSPLGAALIGLRVGDLARWTTPDGKPQEARVMDLLFQPEASGDYLA